MTATVTTAQPVGIMAARINTGDRVEIAGTVRTVDFARLSGTALLVEWTDGTTSRINPVATVTAWI